MAKKVALSIEVHDHIRKANVLHGYFMEGLKTNIPHAIGVGDELLAAKACVPHGRWEDECKRLFDGSVRNAQFYMRLSKHMAAIPKAQANAVLYLEHTLEGAAKAAKEVASPSKPRPPKPPKGKPAEEPEQAADDAPAEEAAEPDYGKCPNCLGSKWEEDEFGVACAKCHHPHGEPAGDVDDDRIKTQRQKTVKTVEALQRAFDDLQAMLAKPNHAEAARLCKELLKLAKGWK